MIKKILIGASIFTTAVLANAAQMDTYAPITAPLGSGDFMVTWEDGVTPHTTKYHFTGFSTDCLTGAGWQECLSLGGTDDQIASEVLIPDTSGLTGNLSSLINDDSMYDALVAFDITPTITAQQTSDITANNAKVTNATHTGDVSGATTLTIATDAVDIPMLSATGTADATTFLRGDNVWTTPSGSGDVTGPASSTDNAIARFDSTTGKIIQGSTVTVDDSGNLTVAGAIAASSDGNNRLFISNTNDTDTTGFGTADEGTFWYNLTLAKYRYWNGAAIADWPGGSGTDADAIHDNVAGEISAITEKVTPISADMIIIEDSADANNKKMVQVGNLPGGASFTYTETNNAPPSDGDMGTGEWGFDITTGNGYFQSATGLYTLTGTYASVPTLTSASLGTDGQTLTMNFSEAVTQGTGFLIGDLDIDASITGNNLAFTLTGATGDGTATHTYPLSTATVNNGETVNLDWAGTVDGLESSSGGDLATILDGLVTNGSIQGAVGDSCAIDGLLLSWHMEDVNLANEDGCTAYTEVDDTWTANDTAVLSSADKSDGTYSAHGDIASEYFYFEPTANLSDDVGTIAFDFKITTYNDLRLLFDYIHDANNRISILPVGTAVDFELRATYKGGGTADFTSTSAANLVTGTWYRVEYQWDINAVGNDSQISVWQLDSSSPRVPTGAALEVVAADKALTTIVPVAAPLIKIGNVEGVAYETNTDVLKIYATAVDL